MGADHPVTLLTIEDDSIVRRAIAAYMEWCGYVVLQAADGIEGLEIFKKESPDLVLTDLRLPKLDGLEVLTAIRADFPDIPVIIVSGMGTLNDAIKALKIGASDYVTKPITDMVLLEHAVERALERVTLVEENRKYQLFLEEEIQKRTAELYQAQKLEAIGTLAGGIAHDFNNILAAIMGFTELALLKAEQGQDLVGDLCQIRKAGERARELVLQILTFSRKEVSEKLPVHVIPLVKEVLKLLRATMPATVEFVPNLCATQLIILADSTEIHQVITNLCTNAFQALPEERGRIEVVLDRLRVVEHVDNGWPSGVFGDFLQIQVIDDGCGMDESTLSNIFDPFFTTKDKGQGTGLGLSVLHGIVTGSGGSIRVESEPGKGTTFSILFPLVEGEAGQSQQVDDQLPKGNERILFVDDEEDLRAIAERMLVYLGYSVETCCSGEEALQKAKDEPDGFDLVITDQSMPFMPGTELSTKLMVNYPRLPILLCTGYSSIISKKEALAMGIKGFLLKPLSINVLAKEIRSILG